MYLNLFPKVLQFLVRDWSYPYEYPYGKKGGSDLLAERLEVNYDRSHSSISFVHIINFNINCGHSCLMQLFYLFDD